MSVTYRVAPNVALTGLELRATIDGLHHGAVELGPYLQREALDQAKAEALRLAEAAREQWGWRSTLDELPPLGEKVLVAYPDPVERTYSVFEARRDEPDLWRAASSWQLHELPHYWRPLPAAPEWREPVQERGRLR